MKIRYNGDKDMKKIKKSEKTADQENQQQKRTEEEFLASYRLEDYDRPSVATDVVAFSVRSEEEESWRKDCGANHLSVLLVKRGEHPYLNYWALPGGFLKMDETLEECALREIESETGVRPTAILPIGSFSQCSRDPRGRIISNAYTTIISEQDIRVMAGEDAADAKWFDVNYQKAEAGKIILELVHEDIKVNAELKLIKKQFGIPVFEILDRGGVAFDHAIIIAAALENLRAQAEKFDIIFEFLPPQFTLSSLQKIQETILGVTMPPAGFRRKISGYVVETEEYTAGAGHRPAKLFRKKQQKAEGL